MPDQGGVRTIGNGWLTGHQRLHELLPIGRIENAGEKHFASIVLLLPRGGAHVAVTIAGPSLLETHAVNHSISFKEMVAVLRMKLRIGSVAEKPPIQLLRKFANDFQTSDGRFLTNRR